MFSNGRGGHSKLDWAKELVMKKRDSTIRPTPSQNHDYLAELNQSAAASEAQMVVPKQEDGEMVNLPFHKFYNQNYEMRQAKNSGNDFTQGMGQQNQPQQGPANRGGIAPVPANNNNRCDQSIQDRRDNERYYPASKRPRGFPDFPHNQKQPRNDVRHSFPNEQSSRDLFYERQNRSEPHHTRPSRRTSRDSPYDRLDRKDSRHSYSSRRESRDSSYYNQSRHHPHYSHSFGRDNRDFEAENSGNQDAGESVDYIHELIQYVRDRHPPEETSPQRHRRSSRRDRDNTKTRNSPSLWDVKKLGISSIDQSDSDNEVFVTNLFPSVTHQPNNNSLPSTSDVNIFLHISHCAITKLTDRSPDETHQTNVNNDIAAESSLAVTNTDNFTSLTDGLLTLPIINRSAYKQPSPIVFASNDMELPSLSASELNHLLATPSNTKIEQSTDFSVDSDALLSPKVESLDLLVTSPCTTSESSSNFSLASPDYGWNYSLVTPPRSESNLITDFSRLSSDIELNHSSVTPPRSGNEPSTDFSLASSDVEYLHSSVTPTKSKNKSTTTEFSPASPEIEYLHSSVTPTKSKNKPTTTDFSLASRKREFLHSSTTPRSKNEPNTDFSPASPDVEYLHSSSTRSNFQNEPRIDKRSKCAHIKPSTDASSEETDIQIIGATETPANTKNEPTLPDIQVIDPPIRRVDIIDLTEDESSTDLSLPLLDIVLMDALAAKTNSMTVPTNITTPFTSTDLNDLIVTPPGTKSLPDQINSSHKRNDQPAAAVPSDGREQSNPKTDLPASHRNVDVQGKGVEALSKKRQIDAPSTPHRNVYVRAKENREINRLIEAGLTAQSVENSSAVVNLTEPSTHSNALTEKPSHHVAAQEIVNQEQKKNEKSTTTVQHVEDRRGHVTTKSLQPVSLNANKCIQQTNRAKEQNAMTSKYSLAMPLDQVLHAMSTMTDNMIKANSRKVDTSNQNSQRQHQPIKQTTIMSEPSKPITIQQESQNDNSRDVASNSFLPASSVSKHSLNQIKPQPIMTRKLPFQASPSKQCEQILSDQNENVNEKRKMNEDCLSKAINKKFKFSIQDIVTNDGKPYFITNRVKQFIVILKIMDSRNGWRLHNVENWNEENFCDEIYHFEEPHKKIWYLSEVKFFDRTSKASKINFKNLFGDEFNIKKYFGIFCKFENTAFCSAESKLIIHTNRDLDETLFNNNGIVIFHENGNCTFKIKQPYKKSKIYNKCLEHFDLPKLADLLNDFSHGTKPHMKMDLLRKYHKALINERVLKLDEEWRDGKRKPVAKFHSCFIEGSGLSEAATELRELFQQRHNYINLKDTDVATCEIQVRGIEFGGSNYEETVEKLPFENCAQKFEKFFKVFTIARIDERDIEKWMNMLDKDFLKLEEKAYSDAMQQELLITIKNHGFKPDTLKRLRIWLKNTISKEKVTEKIRCTKISQQTNPLLDIEVKQASFSSLSELDIEQNIILLSTECVMLSEVKIRQFSKNLGYSENEESLFITDEILLQMTDDVVNAFAHQVTNLLVIVWKSNIVPSPRFTQHIKDVIQRLRDVMNQKSKSTIIIADKSNVQLSMSQHQFNRIDEELMLDSQYDLVKSTKILLQKSTLTLADLANDTAINGLFKSPIILEKLLGQNIKIGRELEKPTGFKEKLYDFKLKRHVIIDSKIFQDKINDVIIIRGISCERFTRDYKPCPSEHVFYVPKLQSNSYKLPPNIRLILLNRKVDPAHVMNNIKGKNVHELAYKSNSFIWKSTIGSSTSLIKYKVTDDNELCRSTTVDDIMNHGPKTVIISGESGSGKSVCLYEFAKLANKLYQTKSEVTWILQVNLNKPLKNTLKSYHIETSDSAIQFLADYLGFKDEQKELFVMSAQSQLKMKLMLFIDGYDNVYEDVDLMTSMLLHLQSSSIQKIFIASNSSVLEETLGIFSYSLQFTNEEKSQFITKFFESKPPDVDFNTKAKLLNTPLHLKMFSELCHKKPEKRSIDNHFNLYKSYVDLYLPSNQLESAYKLSARRMLTDIEFEEIGITIENIHFELPEELLSKSVMEYMTAKWLSKRHLSTKRCINNLVERTSSIFLSMYLAAYNIEKKNRVSINEYAENGFLSFLRAMIKLDGSNKPCLRRLIRKNKNNTLEVLKFLLDHYNDTNCHTFIERSKYPNSKLVKYVNKEVNGQTPLQAAIECEKINVACELILKGADISVLTRSSNFTVNLAIYATKQLANGNTKFGPVAAMMLEKSPQAVAYLDNSIQFPNILSYLFSRGHTKLVTDLLNVRDNRERSQLLESTIDGKSLLDLVNQSPYIEDDDRLSLISYLEKNSHSNLLETHRDSILRFACLAGHEYTFNYFLHPPKTTSIHVLALALRRNDLKVIEFLMRDSKRTIDEKGNTVLHQAVAFGVSRKTINYLLGKVGINDTNNFGETALHLAFEHGANLSTIQFLINAGASLTATDNLGFPTWIHAVHKKNTNNQTSKEESSRCYCKTQQRELLTFLVQKQRITFPSGRGKSHVYDKTKKAVLSKLAYFADPENYDLDYNDQGESRLHSALTSRDEDDWCKFLIVHGADVNVDEDGKPAFHVALNNGRYDVAKLMLQHGVIVDKKDKSGTTPIYYLTSCVVDGERQKMQDILNLIVKIFADPRILESVMSVNSDNINDSPFRFLLNCRNENGRTILHEAAFTGQFKVIDQLYKLSVDCQSRYKDFVPMDVNAVDNDGNSPLHLAVKQDKPKTVEKLLSIGARFRLKNFNGMVLMDMSQQGSDVRKFLQAAEDLFKFVEEQNTSLVVNILKKYPAVQNAKDEEGRTSLFLVKNVEMMKYLLADVNILDIHGRSPMYYAAEEDHLVRVIVLLKAGGIYEFDGFKEGHNKAYRLLQKIDEVFVDMHSHEPRYFVEGNPWALDQKLDDIVNDFGIARDIVVNAKDNQKNTLLHYAAKYDYVDVAKNLLKNGAIFNSRNKYKKTPANLAVSSEKLFESVGNLFEKLDVKNLMDVDPNVATNCRTCGGYTLLLKAVDDNNYETVKWLVDKGADVKATGNNGVGLRLDRSKYPEIAKLLIKN